ncbi:MAG: class I SAM-dependent methyltransferase [bacterium]|nr:class I SAM-dependent methyltransferase [bacterium]
MVICTIFGGGMMEMHESIASPQVYEDSMLWMPWKEMHAKTVGFVSANAPRNGRVLDLMCGTGKLLRDIHAKRPDLQLMGVDNSAAYLQYARSGCSDIAWVESDVRRWFHAEPFDIVVCHGSLHHLPLADQPNLVKTMRALVKEDGLVIVADACVREYDGEQDRRLAVLELGAAYLREMISANQYVPALMLQVGCNILASDLASTEWKSSARQHEEWFLWNFRSFTTEKTWEPQQVPDKDGVGEFVWVLRP